MYPLAIGLIGCGRVAARAHLPVLESLRSARVIAIADPDRGRREAAAARAPDAQILSDHLALLELPALEAVVVCVPNELHAEVAMAAFQRGKSVYLEKPLATTLEDGRRVVETWERAGVVGMIGFNQRFSRLYGALRLRIAEQALGAWVGARTILAAPERDIPAWKQQRGSGGGALLDQGSHHFDLLRYLFDDEILEISAQVRSQRSEGDTAVVHARMVNGLVVQSFLSITTIDEDRIEVYGEAGRISVDRYRSFAGRLTRIRARGRDPSFHNSLARFVAAVREGGRVAPDLQDGYRSLLAVLAAEESARSGRVVRLTEMESGLHG
jgi:predicted dehydrogenase